jgi:hypothetical protein
MPQDVPTWERFGAAHLVVPVEMFAKYLKMFWYHMKRENYLTAKKILFKLFTYRVTRAQVEVLYGIISYLKNKFGKRFRWGEFGNFGSIPTIDIDQIVTTGRSVGVHDTNPKLTYLRWLLDPNYFASLTDREVDLYQSTRNPYYAQSHQYDPKDPFLLERYFIRNPDRDIAIQLLKLNPVNLGAITYLLAENAKDPIDPTVLGPIVTEFLYHNSSTTTWEMLYEYRFQVCDEKIINVWENTTNHIIKRVLSGDFDGLRPGPPRPPQPPPQPILKKGKLVAPKKPKKIKKHKKKRKI